VTSIDTSINVADELIILMVSVNNEHFINAVTKSYNGKGVACGKNEKQ